MPMSKLEEDAYLKRTRATWIAEKLDVNFARANAIMKGISKPTQAEQKKITQAIHKDMYASLHGRRKKK
jgi:hypothetical protein